MKKLKIAVQFFGHLRTFENCIFSVRKNLFDLYDCDIFMHTWDTLDSKDHANKCRKIDKDYIKKLYNLKSLKIDSQTKLSFDKKEILINCDIENDHNTLSSFNMSCMIYSKNQVNELRKNYENMYNIVYDYVLMIRPDIKLITPFDHFSRIKISQFKKRYCALCIKNRNNVINIGEMMSDIIYFSTPIIMNEIVTSLNKIDFESINNIHRPESLYINILQKNNILSDFIYYFHEKNWLIFRKNEFSSMKNIRSGIVSFNLKIKNHYISLRILSILPKQIFTVKINFFGNFYLILSIGKYPPNLIDFPY